MEKARRHIWASKCFFGALESRALVRECFSCLGSCSWHLAYGVMPGQAMPGKVI